MFTWIILGVAGLGATAGSLVLIQWLRFQRNSKRAFLEIIRALEPILFDLEAGREPETARIQMAAADAWTRNELQTMLMFHKRLDLFPEEFNTWEAIAESEMVRWLHHPHELGCGPDEIELMDKVSIHFPELVTDMHYFVFRYRMHPPHPCAEQGWLAGVTGPYVHSPSGRSTEGSTSPGRWRSGIGLIRRPPDSATVEKFPAAYTSWLPTATYQGMVGNGPWRPRV